MNDKPIVLQLLGCYWPGHDASGPNQSFRALVNSLGSEYSFRVVARSPSNDADRGWVSDGLVETRQLPIGPLGARGLRNVLSTTPHDLLVLNGFFDRELTLPALVMRKLGAIPSKPTIISPRGEFASGALSLKSTRKRAWLNAARSWHLLRDVWVHTTADHETEDVERLKLRPRGIIAAPNARTLSPRPDYSAVAREDTSPLRVAFVGRITAVKNVHFALEVLSRVNVPVVYDVYGPIADEAYWNECVDMITRLPDHITVRHRGALAHAEVSRRLAEYDLFFLPTLGENFGHAINEALSAGVPALISDTTPWQGLQSRSAGWTIPLKDKEEFVKAIAEYSEFDTHDRIRLKRGARQLAEDAVAECNAVNANRDLLQAALTA